MHTVGIEIGGTKLQIVVGNPFTGDIVRQFRFEVNRLLGAQGILNQIENALTGLDQPFGCIAVGFGGPVNRSTGIVATSHQIEGWAGFNLLNWFQERFEVPVLIENDANTAAIGEALMGAGRGFSHVFYITLGSGVGGGMVVNGKPYHGAEPGEVEIGLMHFDTSGNTVESFCSGWALNRQIRQRLSTSPSDSYLKKSLMNVERHESEFLMPAVEEGDKDAIEIMEDYTSNLAWGLSHVVSLFNPQIIVIGGGLSNMGELLRYKVECKLQNHVVIAYQNRTKVAITELKELAVPIGALCLSRNCVPSLTELQNEFLPKGGCTQPLTL